jgi:hypothetical protein
VTKHKEKYADLISAKRRAREALPLTRKVDEDDVNLGMDTRSGLKVQEFVVALLACVHACVCVCVCVCVSVCVCVCARAMCCYLKLHFLIPESLEPSTP